MRGKNFDSSERITIRLLLSRGKSIGFIARTLDRSKSGVHGQIESMKASGEIDQPVLDMGQGDDKK